ncbi:hypothetical protein HG536_0H01920 [Torulaspora globosa]|uniref:Methylated-DNA--protein-cysteine methyltransferase n=1 Tax=Torulaspora globosa TaxID=48254 RepID=A0A7G3ZMT1_9SACH|nr:uncharacterized protein HG536_0H01920 [Torulaspora globosa]QLL34817.1 hypothetical protein HG536_0H01920 [Torulaspora globosa]
MEESLTYFEVECKSTNAFLVIRDVSSRLVYLSLGLHNGQGLKNATADFQKLSRKTKVNYVLREGSPENANPKFMAIAESVKAFLDDCTPLTEDYEYLFGTPFQQKVWNELREVPAGQIVNYSTLAKNIGLPKATRAVGHAVGQNKLALIVPCHRCLPVSGDVGNFRWGPSLKKKLLAHERRRKQIN